MRKYGELQPSTAFSAPTQRCKCPPFNSTGKPNQFKKNHDKKHNQCFNCGGFGLFRKDCKKPSRNGQQQKKVRVATNSAEKEVDEGYSYNFFAGEARSEDQEILIKSGKKGATLMGTQRGNYFRWNA